MATYNYFELKQGSYPSIKPGSNWFHIKFDGQVFQKYFGKVGASGDIFRLMEVKNHWIIKNGFTRVNSPAVATATGDLEVSVANELDNAFALQGGADTWIRTDGTDDAVPLAIIADGYVLLTINTEALLNTTNVDFMFEIIVSPWDIG